MFGLAMIVTYVLSISDMKTLFLFGPAANFKIMSITINTWPKYLGICVISMCLRGIQVIVSDVGGANLSFTMYDATVTTVYGFTSCL